MENMTVMTTRDIKLPGKLPAAIPHPALPTIPSLSASLERAVSCPKTSRFDANGNFVGTMETEAWRLPAAMSEHDRQEAAAAAELYGQWLSPGSRDFIAQVISAMLLNWYVPNASQTVHGIRAAQWVEALQEFPGSVVETVCTEWIWNSEEAPKIAHIRRRCLERVAEPRRIYERLQRLAAGLTSDASTQGMAGPRKLSIITAEIVARQKR